MKLLRYGPPGREKPGMLDRDSDHAAESGLEPPGEPVVFAKWTSAISGPHE